MATGIPRATPGVPLTPHPIHASLTRPILFAGAEPGFVIAEASTVLALLFVVGLHVATVLLAIVYATVVHALAVWVTTQDPLVSRVYLRTLLTHDCYLAHGTLLAGPAAVRSAIPPIR